MSRLIACGLAIVAALATRAHADDKTDALPQPGDVALGQHGIGVNIGFAGGGRVTPGGLRVAGDYLYRIDEGWWLDASASFVFGSTAAGCFLDRMDQFVCAHGIADGDSFQVGAAIRRLFAPQQQFRPFAYGGLNLGIGWFGRDGATGFLLPLHAGGGVRAQVSDAIAIIGGADVSAGVGFFGHGLGTEPLFGFAIFAGTEFKL